MMNSVGRGQNGGAARGEGEADQSCACNRQRRFASGADLDDAAFAGEGSGHVEIAIHVESDALWAPQAAEERRHVALGSDLVNAIKTGGGRSGDEQVSTGAESQVVGGNAWLECGEDKDLAIRPDLENCTAAVADVKIFGAVESDSGCYAHALG